MMNAKKALTTALAGALALGVSASAFAEYPEKPIKIMVGFSAGGGTDTTARSFARLRARST